MALALALALGLTLALGLAFALGLGLGLAFGLAFLECSANPWVVALAERRSVGSGTRALNLAQSFNPLGAVGGVLSVHRWTRTLAPPPSHLHPWIRSRCPPGLTFGSACAQSAAS